MTASSRPEKKNKKKTEYIWALCAIMCVCLSVFIWILHHFNCLHRALEAFTGFYITHMQLSYDVQFLSSVHQFRCLSDEVHSPNVFSSSTAHSETRTALTFLHIACMCYCRSVNESTADSGTSTLFFQLRNRQLERILF